MVDVMVKATCILPNSPMIPRDKIVLQVESDDVNVPADGFID